MMIAERNYIYRVYTSSEAADLWRVDRSTISKWIERNKFKEGEFRKSNGTNLISHEAMVRLTNRDIMPINKSPYKK